MSTGDTAYELMRRLFPLCRSLTGDGVRETLDILSEHIPLTLGTAGHFGPVALNDARELHCDEVVRP